MQLFLVRHGEAMTEEENPECSLTEQGKSDVGKLARFLESATVGIDRIWHSAKTRAIQTVEILAEALHLKELCEECEGLNPNDSMEGIVRRISHITPEDEIEGLMIVGHLPFLSRLTSLLLTASSSSGFVPFRPGEIVCLQREDDGPWRLAWAVIPDLLK